MKTSISCVEDAISLTKTRLKLDYGSSLISDVFHQEHIFNIQNSLFKKNVYYIKCGSPQVLFWVFSEPTLN